MITKRRLPIQNIMYSCPLTLHTRFLFKFKHLSGFKKSRMYSDPTFTNNSRVTSFPMGYWKNAYNPT